jgi:cytochrome c
LRLLDGPKWKEVIMRFGKFVVALGMASMLVAGSAFAAERGTPNEAKVLVEKAAAHLKAVGAEKAFADFNNPAAGYQDRDLFVFVYSVDGKILCVPGIPTLVGRDAKALKDVDGKEFGKLIIAAAVGGGGWAEYRMANPATKKTEPKKTFAVQAGDYVLGSGAYNP